MKGLGLIHHVLQSYSIGHKLVVDDGFFLIRWIIGAEMAATALPPGQLFKPARPEGQGLIKESSCLAAPV